MLMVNYPTLKPKFSISLCFVVVLPCARCGLHNSPEKQIISGQAVHSEFLAAMAELLSSTSDRQIKATQCHSRVGIFFSCIFLDQQDLIYLLPNLGLSKPVPATADNQAKQYFLNLSSIQAAYN